MVTKPTMPYVVITPRFVVFGSVVIPIIVWASWAIALMNDGTSTVVTYPIIVISKGASFVASTTDISRPEMVMGLSTRSSITTS